MRCQNQNPHRKPSAMNACDNCATVNKFQSQAVGPARVNDWRSPLSYCGEPCRPRQSRWYRA
jgi:hypothetical protein